MIFLIEETCGITHNNMVLTGERRLKKGAQAAKN
jgi:hypothetical protein